MMTRHGALRAAGGLGMDFYSIAGVDISVEHMRAPGGYRIGDAEHYRVSNCEWSAEFAVRRSWRAPQGATVEVLPSFREGDRHKFDLDLALIGPLVAQVFVAPDATLLMGQ